MTNAEYIEAIGARCSRRTYSHTPPDPRVLEILQEMVDAVNRQSGLSFRLLADGTAPFTLFTGKLLLVAVCGPDTEWAQNSKRLLWRKYCFAVCVPRAGHLLGNGYI